MESKYWSSFARRLPGRFAGECRELGTEPGKALALAKVFLWRGNRFYIDMGRRLTLRGSQVAEQMHVAWCVIRMSVRTAELFSDLPFSRQLGAIEWDRTLVVFSSIWELNLRR